MAEKLWRFIDANGTFSSTAACGMRSLYFPLGNESLMSSVSPDLHGDAKGSQDTFLFAPVSRLDLTDSRSSRNIWVRTASGVTWSATGVSKDRSQIERDVCSLHAGFLWHRIERSNRSVGLRATILSFVPSTGEPVEVTSVTFTNISSRPVSFTPIVAYPVYARSAENIRDHRHVTSLLNRITVSANGVSVKPTLLFSEAGHLANRTTFFVWGCDAGGKPPAYIYPTQEMFTGERGDLESPEAVTGDVFPSKMPLDGREAFGGLRFKKVVLKAGASCTFIVTAGICGASVSVGGLFSRFSTQAKVEEAFARTQEFWAAKAGSYAVTTGDADFDNWFRWVSIQPTLRRIFGCSFLPDFDYGKGGRGWRDLWQDCLGLILSEPERVRDLLLNNFAGVRIDGSNATIIGQAPGEFISDRNNVSRVWMDHGVWPLLTLELYMNETGDRRILEERTTYFLNHERARSRVIDREWRISDGQRLKTGAGEIYAGTVFEHLLAQNLVQFFNVGAHNHIRLEGADWNDGLDMAKQHGESVAFSAMYARNLRSLASLIVESGWRTVELAAELAVLLEPCDYASVSAKHDILNRYFHATNHTVSGAVKAFDAGTLADDLRAKADWMMRHISKTEWLDSGFFNGYYDNNKMRVEGGSGKKTRMSLTSQVFPIMSAAASDAQVRQALAAAKRYLYDRRAGGYRLNTDFGSEMHDLGRAFSFSYGDKENGAVFSHMVVMFAYALYERGLVREGWDVLRSIPAMALNTQASRIYPCLPEYFDGTGRGMYLYLTGSASWFVLTLVTQVFGVKGSGGDLCVAPKLCPENFGAGKEIGLKRTFGGKRFAVHFIKATRSACDRLRITGATLDGEQLIVTDPACARIPRTQIEKLAARVEHRITITMEQ